MKTKIIELLKRAKQNILEILPGLIVCVIIAGISQVIAHFVPTVGAALFAIALGIIVGNTLCTKDFFNRGTKFSESRLLEYSIVLTGLTLNLTDIIHYSANDFDHYCHIFYWKITPLWKKILLTNVCR